MNSARPKGLNKLKQASVNRKYDSFILADNQTTRLNAKGKELLTGNFTKRFNKEVQELKLENEGILSYAEFSQLLAKLDCAREERAKDLWGYLGGEVCDAVGVDEAFKALCSILRVPSADVKEDGKLHKEFSDLYSNYLSNGKAKKVVNANSVRGSQGNGAQSLHLQAAKKSLFIPGEKSARNSYCNAAHYRRHAKAPHCHQKYQQRKEWR
eukprot:TRINITY_DN5491_c0_g1_i5.p1 TRINITY_DN5491_c0_g1~~TRINITY_DN5491_c0_g1_i5.p1  ORF type:complete len:211 (-),score=57.99 TRINITY_DN5491_c0_g1_i5:365-997(-)